MNMLERTAQSNGYLQPTLLAEYPTFEPESLIAAPKTDQSAYPLTCYRHPAVQTGLRCNRCDQHICIKCARRTPVGYRCPDCIRQQENKFYTGLVWDYLTAALVAFPLAFVMVTGFWYALFELGLISIFLTVLGTRLAGGLMADAVHWAVRRRRSRYLRYVVAGSLVVASVPFLVLSLLWWDMFRVIGLGILVIGGIKIILVRLG